MIEPFDPDRHDRTGFSCGITSVDNYFRRTANKQARADNIRVFVMAEGARVIGFYALNAHAVRFTDLPPRYARSRPAHGSIPAAFLSMIGVDQEYQGEGVGTDLLVDALVRIVAAADQLGIAVVVLDVLDCGDPVRVKRRKTLYESFGFSPLPSNPLRLFMPVATARDMTSD